MRKIGKRGRMNQKARKMIADFCISRGMVLCMIQLDKCMNIAHAPAHRKKRRHYKTAEELADPKEWLPACISCHTKIEANPTLTKKVFKELQ